MHIEVRRWPTALASFNEVRAIGCGGRPTGKLGFGATLTHGTNYGKA